MIWDPAAHSWFVRDYTAVGALLRDPRLSARPASMTGDVTGEDREAIREIEHFYGSWMVFSDPPNQTSLRTAVMPHFTRAAVRRLGAEVTEVAHQLAAGLRDGSDLVAEFAAPLARHTIFSVLRVPAEHHDSLISLSRAVMAYLEAPTADPEVARYSSAAARELRDHVARTLVDSGIGPYAELGVTAGTALFAQLLTGGLEPVTACIASMAAELLAAGCTVLDRRPQVDAVVEEALRFDPPFHFVPRRAVERMSLYGAEVLPGQRVVLVLSAANRDPAVFHDATTFRINHTDPTHLAFGAGHHYCLGAALARLTIGAAVTALAHWRGSRAVTRITAERAPSYGTTTWRRVAVHL